MRALLAAVILIASTNPAWAVYKCKNQYGRTVYQEVPCESTESAGEKIDATPARPHEKLTLREERPISVGMTSEEVREAWGRPSDINRTISKHGTREQWVYKVGLYGAKYVYLEDGIVTTIQTN